MFKKFPAFLEGFKVWPWWPNLTLGIRKRSNDIYHHQITKPKLRVKLFKSKTVYLLPIVVGGGVGGFYVEYIDSESHNISTTEYFM